MGADSKTHGFNHVAALEPRPGVNSLWQPRNANVAYRDQVRAVEVLK
jgi:hypothetical protein